MNHYNTVLKPNWKSSSNVDSITSLFEACESSLHSKIGIYLVEEARFVCCNKQLKKMLGKQYMKLNTKGWEYWFSIVDSKEVVWVRDRIVTFFNSNTCQEQLSLRYHIRDGNGNKICVKHEILLYRLAEHTLGVNYFYDVSDKERLEHYFALTNLGNNSFSEAPIFSISNREKQVLQLIAEGYSSKEVADKLCISNHTAISHRKHLIQKFRVKNTAQLIKEAAKVRLL